jgi:hypothetical protein
VQKPPHTLVCACHTTSHHYFCLNCRYTVFAS